MTADEYIRHTLNLGCGGKIIPGACNHDRIRHRAEIMAVWDLNDLPWPWHDNSFDSIVARSVLEHLKLNLVESLDECWRILAPGGTLYLKLPHWNADTAHSDPTHRWFFSLQSLDLFDPDMARGQEYSFYTERKWRIIRPARLNEAGTSIHALLEVRKS
jgi:SAM-dependent methyltransferase